MFSAKTIRLPADAGVRVATGAMVLAALCAGAVQLAPKNRSQTDVFRLPPEKSAGLSNAFDDLRTRPLFAQSRRSSQQPRSAQTKDARKTLTLKGVSEFNNKRAAVFSDGAAALVIREGETRRGVTVTEIQGASVKVLRDGRRENLVIR
ncbi:MAG: hypothetical protein AAF850_00370 [Pseudomonadota bacterium]